MVSREQQQLAKTDLLHLFCLSLKPPDFEGLGCRTTDLGNNRKLCQSIDVSFVSKIMALLFNK